MKDILDQLTSPAWWFTAVFVGLFVSVLGTYARDWVGRVLSNLSKSLAARMRIRRVRRKIRVRFLSRNVSLLQVDYLRAIVDLLLTFFFVSLSFVLPAWDTLVKFYPQVDFLVSAVGVPQLPRGLQVIFYALLLVQSFLLWNAFLRRFSICERARRLHMRSGANRTFKATPKVLRAWTAA